MLTGAFKVGLVWAGRPDHAGDRWRSIKLEQFAPLFDVPGVTWYSLQFGDRAKGVENYPQITDLRPMMTDFAATSALLKEIDLLISVDTSVVHLAGALARPAWVLVPFSPDWRWMLNRTDSPWYPSITLFRQKEKGEWGPVVKKIKEALSQRLKKA